MLTSVCGECHCAEIKDNWLMVHCQILYCRESVQQSADSSSNSPLQQIIPTVDGEHGVIELADDVNCAVHSINHVGKVSIGPAKC